MKHRGLKFLSLLLTLVMLIGVLPGMGLTAYAAANKTITWDSSNWDGLFSRTGEGSHTDENGIAASGNAFRKNLDGFNLDGFNVVDTSANWAANFSISNGKFSSIEIKFPDDHQHLNQLSAGWTNNGNSLTWTGESNEVTLSGDGVAIVTSIVFTIETADATHSVTVTPGSNMTKTVGSGAESQTGLSGAMTPVVYTANTGYYFAEFTDITDNGITAKRTSDTVVTVSGTPTANVNITVPDATAVPTFTVTYIANNGTGETKVYTPAVGQTHNVVGQLFPAPQDKEFNNWLGDDGNTYLQGAQINTNRTLTAQWKDASQGGGSHHGSGSGSVDLVFNIPGADNSWEYAPGYAPQQAYRVSLAPMQGGSAALGLTTGDSGTALNVYPTSAVYVFPNADPGYTLDKIVWSLIDGSASYDITEAKNFIMPAMDVVVYVTFRPLG